MQGVLVNKISPMKMEVNARMWTLHLCGDKIMKRTDCKTEEMRKCVSEEYEGVSNFAMILVNKSIHKKKCS